MLQDLNALLDNPLLLLLVLAAGAAIGIAVERLVGRQRRAERRAYWQGRRQGRGPVATARGPFTPAMTTDRAPPDAVEQLRRVMAASFTARPLLNQPERRLLGVIDNILADECPGWRAMGQVSLGEILSSDDKEAFWAINAKRVDLLIVVTCPG